MKRSHALVILTALLAGSVPRDVRAQVVIMAGAGGTFPTGGFADTAKEGWMAHAGGQLLLGEAPIAVGASGFYGRNTHESPPLGDHTSLYGALAHARYAFMDTEEISPFVGASVGLMTRRFTSSPQPGLDASATGVAAGGFGGVGFPIGVVVGLRGYVQGWWLAGFGGIDNTRLAGVSGGVQFLLGGTGT